MDEGLKDRFEEAMNRRRLAWKDLPPTNWQATKRASYQTFVAILLTGWICVVVVTAIMIRSGGDWLLAGLPAALGGLFLFLAWQARRDLQ